MHWLTKLCILYSFSHGLCVEDKALHYKVRVLPDFSAYIGNVFSYKIPDNEFSTRTIHYKAYTENGKSIPSWLNFDDKIGLFEGVPSDKDLGESYFTVKSFDDSLNYYMKDEFTLEVLSGFQVYGTNPKETCGHEEDKTVLIIVLDADFRQLSSLDRLKIIKKCAQTLGISEFDLKLSGQEHNDNILSDSVLAAGPGNARRNYNHKKSSVLLHWQVGCNGNLWASAIDKLNVLKLVAKDGSLSKNIQHPVVGWRLIKDDSKRLRREIMQELEVVNQNGLEEDYSVPERAVVFDSATPSFGPELSPTLPAPTAFRPHRHNHGSHFQSHRVYRSVEHLSLTIQPTSTKGTDITEPDGDEHLPIEDVSDGSTPPIPGISIPSEDSYNEIKNSPPEISNRIKKLHVTAGKILRFELPEDTFYDREDGYTKNLTLSFRTVEGESISKNFWIQFDQESQTIYGLPLEEQVSKWNFILSAIDSDSLSVKDNIEITVQHHKQRRTVTHAVVIKIESVPVGPSIKWQIKLIEAIRSILHDPEESWITVLSVNATQLPYYLYFTNDSLPTNTCPRTEIDSIVEELKLKLQEKSDVTIGNIQWEGRGHCEARIPETSLTNFPPVIRNPVDHLNATVGQLLLYTVPEDTFYDRDDGSTRGLNLKLLNMDMREIAPNNWLQFDEKNQEFFGIPMATHTGQTEYLLKCTDSDKLTVSDSLVVTVHPAPKTLYNVEFSMKLGVEYHNFVENPSIQRNFVERLSLLFNDPNSNSIVLSGLSPGSTVVTWHNKSLPTSFCPDNDILHLRQVLLNDDEKVTSAVVSTFGPEFPVLSAKLTPTGLCQGSLTKIFTEVSENITTDVTAISQSEQYIIGLVVPTVVIAVMLLCAGFVACILYRRRRTGKMSVGDEDEKQSFRSKGIPVIFQDELDERPEPSNKSPVIMKEEKPPLPPPEYQRGPPLVTTALLSDTEDTPYQPPPPFTTSRDSARPKPTPAYRMPPPYVPP